jgi:hypothetical protein
MGHLKGSPCVLCGAASTRVGEHVWPAWFLSEFYDEGPFEASKAGVAYTARDSPTPLKSGGLPGVHVPMCESCNTILNTRFEEPAKPVVRQLIPLEANHIWPKLSAPEVQALALWLLKVGLLTAHPAAVHDLPQVNNDSSFPRLDPFLSEWTSWMSTGSLPPGGFSVYVTRRAVTEDVELGRLRRQVQLPKILVDGRDIRLVQRSFGFRGLNVTIVWHPGWDIKNAQVDEGRAVRLWPQPAETDFALLPEVNPREFEFVDASIVEIRMTPTAFDIIARTPLNHETNALDLMIASISD